jgi:hypothetical protein
MADYLKWLAGIPITAIDHHPSNFLRFAESIQRVVMERSV